FDNPDSRLQNRIETRFRIFERFQFQILGSLTSLSVTDFIMSLGE
ncbi:7006_t:CDS:1, partial [Entrophospora sp. SA101]